MLWKTREMGTPVSWSTICRAKSGLPISERSALIISAYTKGRVPYKSLRLGNTAGRKARARLPKQRERRRAA